MQMPIPAPTFAPGMGRLGTPFATLVAPQGIGPAHWVGRSAALARELGLADAFLHDAGVCDALAGNRLLPGSEPAATVYSGHQFGVWAGQLGDGRALLLGEAGGQEWQLKGSGRTPYSRMGDGRAVLRSSIREFLCSEAMHALGIPTTRALAVVGSALPVRRETVETAAVVTRTATSFIRFGHFEHFAAAGDDVALRTLADHVIAAHYPECRDAADPYAALLAAVTLRTAGLVAQWQAVGFCHGVMNTDNMSILGLTLDYGPFQFLDAYVPGHICNHSDAQGRYAYNQQPNVAYWNCFCLGQALMPLIGDSDRALAALEPFRQAYPDAFRRRLRAKLGLPDAVADADADTAIADILRLLAAGAVDWTIFWRRWAQQDGTARDLFPDRDGFDAWVLSISQLVEQAGRWLPVDSMLQCNPKFVLRNWLGERAIQAAQAGDFAPLAALQALLEAPYADHPGYATEAGFPPNWAASIAISCSS